MIDKTELERCSEYFHNLSTKIEADKRVTKIWDQYGRVIWEESDGPMPELYAKLFDGARILPAKQGD